MEIAYAMVGRMNTRQPGFSVSIMDSQKAFNSGGTFEGSLYKHDLFARLR